MLSPLPRAKPTNNAPPQHNASDDRVTYRVTVTAIGANQDSTITLTTRADNVFPHTTWPTQIDITAADAHTSPTRMRISLHVVQDAYPFGDSP
ncbi:hypothetical protein AB0L66_20995 [Streptomyces sp. NPDC052207]|uniref:hypothetical protein n=1 Tax=Streptomyces sp. NPDC052207 TaxID=3155418 RepID=UPI00341566AB